MDNYYFGLRTSLCHNSICLIVKSRRGGFVSQNCLVCGKPFTISLLELPEVNCKRCGSIMTKDFDRNGNYQYSCPLCRWSKRLCDLVPHWSELFEENGLGLLSDFDGFGSTHI